MKSRLVRITLQSNRVVGKARCGFAAAATRRRSADGPALVRQVSSSATDMTRVYMVTLYMYCGVRTLSRSHRIGIESKDCRA